MKILIDTNIFLGLYHSNNDNLKIFEDIEKIKPNLVIIDQIIDEFLRNRDEMLIKLLNAIKKDSKISIYSSSIIRNSAQFKRIDELQREFKENVKNLTSEIEDMLYDTGKDLIFTKFFTIFSYTDESILKRDEDILKKALKRKLIGNPPFSDDKNTIGDEIIWELLLDNIDDDLIIITRDGTYEKHRTFLINEFFKKTGKRLLIDENVGFAIEQLGMKASEETNRFDQDYQTFKEIISESPISPEYFEELRRACTISPEYFEELRRACTISPEYFEELRRACTISPEYFEELRRACTISPEYFEELRRACTISSEYFEELQRACTISPEEIKRLTRRSPRRREDDDESSKVGEPNDKNSG